MQFLEESRVRYLAVHIAEYLVRQGLPELGFLGGLHRAGGLGNNAVPKSAPTSIS